MGTRVVSLLCAALTTAAVCNAEQVTCSSDDGGRHVCRADTRGGVRLSRQISGSPCRQGQTWGWDASGIWVDRGCRAEFETGLGGGYFPGGGSGTIRCSSEDGERHFCAADTRGGVRLSRQISGSPCRQGDSWGYDRRGIWVDRGCRAEFEVGVGGGGMFPGGGAITCSSDDGGRHTCPADTRGGVRMSRQISGSPCREGYSWGYDPGAIWVDRGCRAEFEVGRGGGSVFPGGGGGITCSSEDGGRHTCPADTRGGVRMSRQISGSPCREGYSWGYDFSSIWVDRGCRAEFQVGGGGGGYYPGAGGVITCSSDDGGRHFCAADTRGGVRLSRQISGSPCRQGESWGYDSRGIWVDRGCRAEFETRRR